MKAVVTEMKKLINDTSLKSVSMTVAYKELPKGYVTK